MLWKDILMVGITSIFLCVGLVMLAMAIRSHRYSCDPTRERFYRREMFRSANFEENMGLFIIVMAFVFAGLGLNQ